MSIKNRVKATAKNIEGKEKQAEAKITNAVEDVKDQAKKMID
jgi:uncharacterized protein YjbJ (UPF0337 family)